MRLVAVDRGRVELQTLGDNPARKTVCTRPCSGRRAYYSTFGQNKELPCGSSEVLSAIFWYCAGLSPDYRISNFISFVNPIYPHPIFSSYSISSRSDWHKNSTVRAGDFRYSAHMKYARKCAV